MALQGERRRRAHSRLAPRPKNNHRHRCFLPGVVQDGPGRVRCRGVPRCAVTRLCGLTAFCSRGDVARAQLQHGLLTAIQGVVVCGVFVQHAKLGLQVRLCNVLYGFWRVLVTTMQCVGLIHCLTARDNASSGVVGALQVLARPQRTPRPLWHSTSLCERVVVVVVVAEIPFACPLCALCVSDNACCLLHR